MSTPAGGRRRADPAPVPARPAGRALVLTVLAPVLVIASLALVRTSAPEGRDTDPEVTTVTRTDLACPQGRGGVRGLALAVPPGGADGTVDLTATGSEPTTVEVSAGRVTTETEPAAAVATGLDDVAPGLLAARLGEAAAASCTSPRPETWFTGVGARPQHASVLELHNPDPGPAVADVRVLTPTGDLDVPALRGVRVPGRSVTTLDLAGVVPRRVEMALQVSVVRGRLVPSVWDTVDRLGAGPAAGDWLPGEEEPATAGTLLGLGSGQGSRSLVLANGGEDEARVDLQVVSPESVFTPAGLEEVRVAPGTVETVRLTDLLGPEVARGALGLAFTSSHPVTATLRSFVGDDLGHAVPSTGIEVGGTVLVPAGPARGGGATLSLAGAGSAGVVEVTSRDAAGRALPTRRVEIVPEQGVSVRLPRGAALVGVTATPDRVDAVLVGPDARYLLPVSDPETQSLVPHVRPALP